MIESTPFVVQYWVVFPNPFVYSTIQRYDFKINLLALQIIIEVLQAKAQGRAIYLLTRHVKMDILCLKVNVNPQRTDE